MFAFLKSLIGDSSSAKDAADAAKEASERESKAKAAKLSELCSRLGLIFKKDPLQVLGVAFVVEVDPAVPQTVSRADWQRVMSLTEKLLSEAGGKDGFVRRVSAVDYFVRFGRAFDEEGNLACDSLFRTLPSEIGALGCGNWNIRLRAALPARDEIHFVPVEDTATLLDVLKPFSAGRAEAPGKPAQGIENELVDGANRDGSPITGQSAIAPFLVRGSAPDWRRDGAWKRVSDIPEWREVVVHGRGLQGTPGEDTGGQEDVETDKRTSHAVKVRTFSAADRMAEAEASIAEDIERVEVRYQPLWDMATKRIAAAFAVPALVQDSVVTRMGDDLFGKGISATVSGKLDRHLLRRAWADMEIVGAKTPVTLLVPMHFAGLQNSAVRQGLVGDLRMIAGNRPPGRNIISVIVHTPVDASVARLGEFAQTLRTLVDGVWVEYAGPDAHIGALARSSVAQVGFEVSPMAGEDALMASAIKFIEATQGRGIGTFARGQLSANMAQGLPAVGVDCLAGNERLTDLLAAASADRRFDLDSVVAR